ncbi:uncharacterized protein FYW61_004113 [Anableps anableps]
MSVANWEVPADQVLITEERNSIVDHKMPNAVEVKEEDEEPEPQQMGERNEEPEPEPIKEEHIELWVFQDEEEMLVLQKTNTSIVTPSHKEIPHNVPGLPQMKEEPEPVQIKEEQEDFCNNQHEVQLQGKQETETFIMTSVNEQNDSSEPEPNQNQLLSAHRPKAESQYQQGGNQEDSGSGNTDPRPGKRPQDTRNHSDNVDNPEPKRQKTDLGSCEICGKLFRTRQYPPEDTRIHTGEKLYSCEVCGKSFKKKRIHAGETPKPCKLDGKTFSDQPSKVGHDKEKLYPCEVCGKLFKTRQYSPRDMRMHADEKLYSCEVCGKSFKKKRIHTGESSNTCKRDGKTFSDQPSKVGHNKEKLYPCEVCGKIFKTRRYSPEDTRMHTGEKLYSCEVYGKSFKKKRIHTGETSNTCKLHGKSFSDRPSKVRQAKGKLYPYEVCGKPFKGRGRLAFHHQKCREKPFSCLTCGKSFTCKSASTLHRSHTGEKPLPCEVCGKHFK